MPLQRFQRFDSILNFLYFDDHLYLITRTDALKGGKTETLLRFVSKCGLIAFFYTNMSFRT